MNINKTIINSLFTSGGTLSEKEISEMKKYEHYKHGTFLYKYENNILTFIYNNNVYRKNIEYKYDYSYKLLKNKIYSNDNLDILNSNINGFKNLFFDGLYKKYIA